MEAYIFVIATAIGAGVAIWKAISSGKKGKILEAVIKGVEDSVGFIPKDDLAKVKIMIKEQSERYGVAKALDKLVKLVTKKGE